MNSRNLFLKELLSKTIEPAILIVDEKLCIQYYSPNTAHYIKLPKTFNTLKQIETLNKVAFTTITKKAIRSIKSKADIKISENLPLKDKNYSINLKTQKLQTEPLKEALFSISISKINSFKISELDDRHKNDKKNKINQIKILEDKLSRTFAELSLLKRENEDLKADFETTHKNLEHEKTEYDINLKEQYELNFFMTEMLKNSNVATVFLNLDLQIIKYTPLLSNLFNVENRDIGRKITDFNHVFTSNDWIEFLKNAKNSDNKIELELTTKNDQYYLMIINPAKFSHVVNNVLSVSFVNISSQVKANQAKIASEEKFRTLFESAADGMSIIDLDKKTIVACNKKMPALFGLTKEVYLSIDPFNLFPEFQSDGTKSIDLIKKMHITLHQKGQVSQIVEHNHKTKGTFFARLSKYKIPSSKQNLAAVVLQDIDKEIRAIDALKQNEIELKDAEARYRSLFEHAIDGIIIFDLVKQKAIAVNNSLVKMSGFSKAELIARYPLNGFTTFLEDGSPTEAKYLQTLNDLKTKKTVDGNFIHLHKSKAPFHVTVKVYKMPEPNHQLIVGVVKNIDAQKKVEAKNTLHLSQLEASKAMHKAFFNQSLDGHVILNLEDMMPVEVNKRLLQMLRVSKTEYFASPFDLFDAETNPVHMEKMFQDLRAGLEKNKTFEAEFYIKSSKRKSFLVKVLIHKLSAPNQHLAYAVIKDIDKERKAEEAAKAHVKALTASESMHKTFFNQSLDAHLILSAESMTAVEVNHRTLKLLRISKTEFFNTDLYDFCDSTKNDITQAQFFEAIQASLAKNIPYEAEMYMKSSKRKSFLAKLLINQMPAPNEHLIYSVIKDIDSERKAKEAANTHLKALTESENLFRTFFENGQDGFAIGEFLPKPKPIDGNPRLCEMLGLSKKEYLSSNPNDFFSPIQPNNISVEEIHKKMTQNLSQKGIFKGEVIYVHKKNGPFYVNLTMVRLKPPNDNRVFVQVANKDKEVKALQQLAASESLFRTFFENGLDGFGIAQIFPKPKPIDVNPRMLELTGLSKKEFLNSNILDFINPEQANNKSGKEIFDEITQSLIQKGFYRGEVIYKHKKNGPFYANITMVRLKSPNDNKVFIQVANKDKEVKALQQVAKSEALFKSIFANSLDGIVIYNMDTFEAIDCNERVLEMTNCSRNEFGKAQTKDFLPEKQPDGKDSFSTFKQYLKNVTERKSINKEWLFKRYNSDELVYARISIIKLPAPFKQLAAISIADITETKLAEQAVIEKSKAIQQTNEQLKNSLKKFNDTFTKSANYIARFNLKGHLIEHNSTVYNNLLDKNVVKNNICAWSLPRFSKHKKAQKQIKRDFALAKKGQDTKSQVPYTVSPNFSGFLEYTFKPVRNEKGEIDTILAEGFDVTELVNSLKRLEINEQKFRAIYNNSSNFIGIFDKKGILLDHNLTVSDKLANNQTQSVGMPLWDFPWFTVHKESQREYKRAIKKASTGKRATGIVLYSTSSEFTGTMQYDISPIFDENGKVIWILGEGKDITEITNAQKELAYKEQKFRAIFNNSSNLIALYDTQGYVDDLNQPLLNQNAETEISKTSQKVKVWNRPLIKNLKESQKKFKASFEKALEGKIDRNIIQYQPVGKSHIGILEYTMSPIFDDDNKVLKILAEGKDITEQINAQKELAYKEQKFRAIFNNSSNFIGLYDTKGYIEELNQPLLKRIYSNEFPGTFPKIKVWDIPWIAKFKESQDIFKVGFKKALKGEIDRGIIQYAPVANQTGIFEYTLSPIFDENKKVIKVLGEGKDITEKIEVQKEIEASEKRFRDLFYNAKNRVVRLSPDGKVLAHNKIHRGRKNYATTQNYIGKYLWDFLAGSDTKTSFSKIKQDFKKAVKGELVSNILSITNSKNEELILNYSLKPVFGSDKKVEWVLGESNDITAFTNAQKQVLKNEQKFRAIFNNSSNFIGLYDLDGTIEELNKPIVDKIRKSKKTKHNSKPKLWQLPLSNAFKTVIKQTFIASLKKVLKGEVHKTIAQYCIKDKEDVCLELIFSPVFDENNKVYKVLGEGRDITEQMNSRKEVEASEKRFKALFVNAENVVVRLSPEGRVIEHNKIVKSAENYEQAKTYIGRFLWEFSGVLDNKESQEKLKRDILKAAKGKLVSGTIFSRNDELNQIQLAYSFKPVFGTDNKKVEWILGEARDITDFVEAQNQLLENEQKFKAIFYNSENFVVRLDAKGKVLEHSRIHKDNPRYASVKKYVGKPLWEFSGIVEHPESIAKLKKDIKTCAAGKVVSNQIPMRIYKLTNNPNDLEYKSGLVVYSLKPVRDKNNKVEWILAEAKDITELDKAKNELSTSLNKYQKLFENNLVGIITLDENLKLIECNNAYEKITGYSIKDDGSFDYYSLIDEKEIEEAKLNEHKIRTSKVNALQFKRTLIKKNGEKIFVHIYLKPIYNNNKFVRAVVTIADITELEKNRNALKQSEQLYKAVFDGVNDGLYVYDLKNHRIVTLNKRLLQISGYNTEKQFVAEANKKFIPYVKGKNALKINWLKKINTQFKTQKVIKYDLTIQKANGLPLDISTTSIHLSDSLALTAVTDITETKKAQNALLESETRYRSLFENNITGIALGDNSGNILQVNDALCAMFGYTKNEMLQLRHQDLSVQGGDDQSYLHFKAMVQGKSKKFSTTNQFVKKNGVVFYAIINVSGIYDEENNFKYNIASISDISELKHLENELKEKQIELADKVLELEKYIESNLELENFAFIASHDLKSPTQTIIDFSNLLAHKATNKLDKQEQQFLKFIIDGSERLQNTIRDLLHFSLANNNNLNIEKVNLKNLIKDVIKDLDSVIKNANATIKIEGLPTYNWIDKGLYKALFLNLISNAIKFQKNGNKAVVKITCNKTANGYLFDVKDNGIGIAKKSQHKIFGIFKRLHNYSEYEGTGIGLALCKKVVEKHNGKIWVESAKGKGADFFFTLPRNLK